MRFITIKNNKVASVRNGTKKVKGEVESEKGEPGQILQEDGTFKNPEQEKAKPTLQEEMEMLKEQNIILMDALATIYEKMIMKGVL